MLLSRRIKKGFEGLVSLMSLAILLRGRKAGAYLNLISPPTDLTIATHKSLQMQIIGRRMARWCCFLERDLDDPGNAAVSPWAINLIKVLMKPDDSPPPPVAPSISSMINNVGLLVVSDWLSSADRMRSLTAARLRSSLEQDQNSKLDDKWTMLTMR